MQPKVERTTWHWYVGRDNELLLDLDSDAAVWWCVEKLRRNMRRGFLEVRSVVLHRSIQPHHYHVIVTLEGTLEPIARAVWEMHLGSDIKRAAYNVMRTLRGLEAADLLIADRRYPDVREPDYQCNCRAKHKRRRITHHCPVLRALHGDQAGAEYFAIRHDRRKRTERLELPVGRIPLSRILQS